LLWFILAIIIIFALFPALWIMPLETISNIYRENVSQASGGHINGHFFFGKVIRDPGVFYYPVSWLYRVSPLILLGGLGIVVAQLFCLRKSNKLGCYRTKIIRQPIYVALVVFTITFFVFVTLSPKKLDRYLLPIYPVVAVFAAWGIFWLARRIANLFFYQARQGFQVINLIVIVMVVAVQGWLLWKSYPYYITYFNPALGGAKSAAQLMTIFGWGEGLNEAAHYLNNQPEASSLHVVSDNVETFAPYFKGQALEPSNNVAEILKSDYVIYYISRIQRGLHRTELWRFFSQHYQPVYSVKLNGLDYALVYHSPITRKVDITQNSIPGTQILGYDIVTDGILTLFWQNIEFDSSIWIGLLPAMGDQILWVPCQLDASFKAEANIPGAILESRCNLAEAEALPEIYSLHLGYGTPEKITEVNFPAGRLALQINADGTFNPANPETAIAHMAQTALPESVTPLDESVGSLVRLVGYNLAPAAVLPGKNIRLTLYWQALQDFDLVQFSDAFEISFGLVNASSTVEGLSLGRQPLTGAFTGSIMKQGAITPIEYRQPLPIQMAADAYQLKVCIIETTSDQTVSCVFFPIEIKPGAEQ